MQLELHFCTGFYSRTTRVSKMEQRIDREDDQSEAVTQPSAVVEKDADIQLPATQQQKAASSGKLSACVASTAIHLIELSPIPRDRGASKANL